MICFFWAMGAEGATYLWVGGSGNWSDTLHWSSFAGGIPTKDDDVFFDANSFASPGSIVNIDITASCKSMDWTQVALFPELVGDNNLNIWGSLLLTNKLTWSYTGDVYFKSNANGNFIATANLGLQSNIYFLGSGEWELQDSLKLGVGTIYFIKGLLNTNGNYLECGGFYSISSNGRQLELGDSQILIKKKDGEWKVDNQLKMLKGTSVILFEHPDFTSENLFQGGGLAYHKVIFANDAEIKDSNIFDRLFFNASQTYKLEGGKTQTINQGLRARGCSGIIEITSTGPGQAFIAKSMGDINISFVSLNSIMAVMGSGNSFNATHSIDMGNNTNCNITADSRDMYWVDNTGNWSDTLHWSSFPSNADADCVPVRFDNVFFDDNSFSGKDTVNVDLQNISCSDMMWTTSDEAVFKEVQSGSSLHVYGSLKLAGSMENLYGGEVFFRDSLGGKSIQSNGNAFNNNIYFYGAGSWSLLDSLNVNASLYFNNGTLFSNDRVISCNVFRSDTSSQRTINLGSSRFNVKMRSPYPAWSLNDTNLVFNAGTSRITLFQGSSTLYSYGGDTIRYHIVEFQDSVGIDGLMTDAATGTYCKFRKVVFSSNAQIFGENTYDTISLAPACFYELPVNKTQIVIYDIWPSGVCDGPVLLQSGSNGTQASLETPDSLFLEYTSIRDISALGGSSYIAENSVDLGNNDGWDTIVGSAPGKLFWVGGEGNWSDPFHWDTVSGGPGGLCVPTPFDTVVFDNLSFSADSQIVHIDQNNVFMYDMTWTEEDHKPGLAGISSNCCGATGFYLRIYGSLKFMPDVDFTFPGFIYFETGDTGQVINTTGVKFHNLNNHVYFNGLGSWTLLDSLNVGHSKTNRNSIYFVHGKLNTNGHYVNGFDFYSNYSFVRELDMDTSYFDFYNNWVVNGINLQMPPNGSFIEIDSGYLYHRNGMGNNYNSVHLMSDDPGQYINVVSADSIMFNDVVFYSDAVFKGTNSSITAEKVYFSGSGKINESSASNVNVFTVDSLLFKGIGELYGNNTVNYTSFDSTGLIDGNGVYTNTMFFNNGDIYGYNIFDTLSFSPGYFYQLEGDATQTINNKWNIRGNNCQPISLVSTTSALANVEKENGFVHGELIEMNKIRAMGGATFDAGNFSTDINNSNVGWIFNELPFHYSIGNDTSFLEGDTVYLCATYFNGNSSTSYTWRDCDSGTVLGVDSCVMVAAAGNYCLEVNYDEGDGCTKFDTVYVGCTLGLLFEVVDVSCNGFTDGAIEMNVQTGTAPFDVFWYNEGNLVGNTLDISDLGSGNYFVSIEDDLKCSSNDSVFISQPDSLLMEYNAMNSCFEMGNGQISLNITGGTEPYDISWPDGSDSAMVSGLSPGQYLVNITDAYQCPIVSENIVIDEWDAINFNLQGSDLLCYKDASGFIKVADISGGTGVYPGFDWYKDGGYYGSGQLLDTLQTGNYVVVVTDDFGCAHSDSIFVLQPDSIALYLNAQPGLVELGSIELEVEGGTLPYSYLWSTGAVTQNVDPLGGGYYSVRVTDGNGCENTDSIFVEVRFRILAPTAFSPNGDNLNDVFMVKGLGTDLVRFELNIYDRWGAVVFKTNDILEGWNGKLFNNGEPQPKEVYTWSASLEYSSGEKIADKGNVTLLR
ncbi:MAG: T9SS type B sorting domain-containing protein [Chlorobi bacterium]|nr:T9SS type B sorting domain-containing protein [Chlorobiota bacterium]